MHPSLKLLIELQRIDLEIAEKQSLLASFPKRLAEAEAPVAAARAALAKFKDAHVANVRERKKYELDVESWKEKARKYRGQTSEVKSNEAYKALLHEIETAEAEVRKAEDKLLEHMVAGEEFERQVKTGEKSLTQAEAAAKQTRESLMGDQARVEQAAAMLAEQRKEAFTGIPEDLLFRYQRLAKRYHGLALAQMVDEACTGCRVHLRPHVVQRVRQLDSEEIVECESCTRILYYIEEPSASGKQAASGRQTSTAEAAATKSDGN
jgi:predicted  nucleic acid-binding Zn-ribbon protein